MLGMAFVVPIWSWIIEVAVPKSRVFLNVLGNPKIQLGSLQHNGKTPLEGHHGSPNLRRFEAHIFAIEWHTFYINRLFEDVHTINITYCTKKLHNITSIYHSVYIFVHLNPNEAFKHLMLFNCIFKSQCFTSMAWWLPNIIPPDSAKVKGAIVDGPFLSGRKSLAAIPMGSKPGPISCTKIWSKVVDEVVQNQQKNIALQEPKLKKLHQYSLVCVCVSVFLGQKLRYVDEEPTLPIWIVLKFRTFLQPKLIFLSISILCEVSKKSEIFVETIRYGLKWGHQFRTTDMVIYIFTTTSLNRIEIGSGIEPLNINSTLQSVPLIMEQQTSLVSESLVCTFTKCQKKFTHKKFYQGSANSQLHMHCNKL